MKRTTEMHAAGARLYLPAAQQKILDRAFKEATKGRTLSAAEEAAVRNQAARQFEATGKASISVQEARRFVREALFERRENA